MKAVSCTDVDLLILGNSTQEAVADSLLLSMYKCTRCSSHRKGVSDHSSVVGIS